MSLFPGLVSVWVDWGDVQPSIHYFNQLTSLFFYLKISKPKFYFLKFEEYLKYSSYETWPHSPLQPQSLNQKEEEKAGVKPVRLWPGKPLELMRDKIMKWTEAGGNMRSVTATQSSYPYKKAISNVWSFPYRCDLYKGSSFNFIFVNSQSADNRVGTKRESHLQT